MNHITRILVAFNALIVLAVISTGASHYLVSEAVAKGDEQPDQFFGTVYAKQIVVGDKDGRLHIRQTRGGTIQMLFLGNHPHLNPDKQPRIELSFDDTEGPKLIMRNGERFSSPGKLELTVTPAGDPSVFMNSARGKNSLVPQSK